MKIGNLELDSQVLLAPMAGVTNIAYRTYMKQFGIGLTFSEMISDCGLIYNNKETLKYVATNDIERPVALQIFGGNKENLLSAIDLIEKFNPNYDVLDVNLGCPVPKVTKTGAGSAWLNRKDELLETMTALVQKSSRPVTAKIRIGWDANSINVEEIVKVLEQAGVSLITIHPRTRAQLYSGFADYERIKNIKSIINVPLAISGDIFSLEAAIKAKELTNADFIMVARGALGNPYLVTQIDHYLKTGEKLENATLEMQLNYLNEYAIKLIELKGEYIAINELRGIAPHFLKGFTGTKQYRVKFASGMTSYEEFKNICEEVKNNCTLDERVHN